jgi:hypothetical protein
MAPERLLLAAREARDLRPLSDTSIAGATHARVAATVEGFPVTLFVSRSTGFPTAVRFRTAEPNDFGLVPYGEMPVEFWYSGWRKQPSGIVYPYQWDVRRLGQPYKRMTVMGATFNPPATPDSFAVSDSLRGAFLATARRPMHDVPLDSARLVEGRFASFGAPGSPVGAVKIGRQWLLLETGQAPLSVERAVTWLGKVDSASRIGAALVTIPATGNGGTAWLVSRGVSVRSAPGAMPFLEAVLRGHATPPRGLSAVTRAQWMHLDGDSLWVEPIDLPDASGALLAYVPSLEWVYSGLAANAVNLDQILNRARARGWKVSRVGSARGVATPLPPTLRVSNP